MDFSEKWNKSIEIDEFLWDAEVRSSLIYAKGLLKAGVLNKREYKVIEDGLKSIKRDKDICKFEDVHIAVLKKLIEKAGKPGKKLHTGRSRNEQVATDERIWLKEKVEKIVDEIEKLQKVVIKVAEENRGVIMPGYTHLRQAKLVLFSHYIMSLFWKMERGKERLLDALKRVDELPLGSGAIAGSYIPVDVEFLRRELGFSKVFENSIDAISDRNFILEILFSLSLILLDLSRYAEDFIIFSSEEFSFISFEFKKFKSSMMPHKQNPDVFELVRAKAGKIWGYLTSLYIALKGTPLSYNKDMQEDKIPLKQGVEEALNTIKAFREMLGKIKLHEEKIKGKISHFVYSTDILAYLVEKGLDFEGAYEIVQKICEYSKREDIPFECIPLKKYREFSKLFKKDIYLVFSPESSIRRKKTYCSTHPAWVSFQVKKAREILKCRKVS